VVHILSKHLNYHWLYCIGFNGNRKNEGQNNIIEQWQPALVYFKPPFKKDKIAKDFSKCVGENSDSYNNQLSESGLPYFVEMFSAPGDVVLDPFMGTGEVLKVSKKLNRMSIGIDVDFDCVEIAKGRLR
jgi:DNA modification methylase